MLSRTSAAHEERAREHQKNNGPLHLKKSYENMLSVRRNGIRGREQARIRSEQKDLFVYSSIPRKKKKGERMPRRLFQRICVCAAQGTCVGALASLTLLLAT